MSHTPTKPSTTQFVYVRLSQDPNEMNYPLKTISQNTNECVFTPNWHTQSYQFDNNYFQPPQYNSYTILDNEYNNNHKQHI